MSSSVVGPLPPAEVRTATEDDWPALLPYYRRVYRDDHPITDPAWWRWRFGDPEHGRALVAVADGEVVGHLGVARADGLAWLINVHLDPAHRGRGLLRQLYGTAREDGPLITTNANKLAVDMYRNMGWHRLADLQRFVSWDRARDAATLTDPVDRLDGAASGEPPPGWQRATGHHHWDQPGLTGWVAPDGSTVVDALHVGGLRVVELVDPGALVDAAHRVGARWLDLVTSWNDPWCRDLESRGWRADRDAPVPWLLEPVVAGSRAEITVLCEEPVDPRLIIRRWHCDHGRVGSIRRRPEG